MQTVTSESGKRLGCHAVSLAILLSVCASGPGHAADITWSEPMAISSDTNVCTVGTLDRAFHFGSDQTLEVNGVAFAPLNAPKPGDDAPFPEILTDSTRNTELAIAADGEGFWTKATAAKGDLTAWPHDYRLLLASGVANNGPACALDLRGLTVGQFYIIQVWVSDSANSSATETLSAGTESEPICYNATVTAGNPGQYILGIFAADDEDQPITICSDRDHSLINAFQLRLAPQNSGLSIVEQPAAMALSRGQPAKLSVLAAGRQSVTYQWQKIAGGWTHDLFDSDRISGSTNYMLCISELTSQDAGDYRAIVSDGATQIASSLARISILPPEKSLINVNIRNGSARAYRGNGVLLSNGDSGRWNGLNGRNGFKNAALVDATGAATPVRLTLSKPREDGWTRMDIENDLFREYSPASAQTVTLDGLEPDCFYDLVVYSLGMMANEGGVFSGAVEGIVSGGNSSDPYWTSQFFLRTNYLRNPFAKSDAAGRLQFVVKATSSVSSDGFYNGDFNGLQIAKFGANTPPPVILSPPCPATSYQNQPVVLSATFAAPPGITTTCQWQRLSSINISNVTDDSNLIGATSPTLTITHFRAAYAGNYRLVVSGQSGSVASPVVRVSLKESPYLVNVDIKNEADPVPAYTERGVLNALGGTFWNGVNGRRSFENIPLADNAGQPTAVTLSLSKEQVDSYTSPRTSNNLLKDYSVGHPQTVTLKNLEPNARYRLVAYSFGAVENEGGVFSGALQGIVHGWAGAPGAASETFISGTNYLENDSALTDTNGSLTFTIQPTSTVFTNGFYNSDFNGLQVMRTE